MIEFLQIILSFFLFSLIIFVPINIFKSKLFFNRKFFCLDIASFNLILNCNILLFLSILPISLGSYNLLYLFLYIFIFIYNYFIQNFKLNLYKNFIQFLSLFFIENQNFSDLNKFTYNDWHPHLGSYFWAFFWNLMPIKFEYFGRLFYVFLFCFSIFYVCHNNLRDKFISHIIFILIILIFYM